MSSAAYIQFKTPVQIADWDAFCADNKIDYSPCTVGWNVYYFHYFHGMGGVEITFGEGNFRRGAVQSKPTEGKKVTVSSFFGKNLSSIATVVKLILSRWPDSTWTSDPEVLPSMVNLSPGCVGVGSRLEPSVQEPVSINIDDPRTVIIEPSSGRAMVRIMGHLNPHLCDGSRGDLMPLNGRRFYLGSDVYEIRMTEDVVGYPERVAQMVTAVKVNP